MASLYEKINWVYPGELSPDDFMFKIMLIADENGTRIAKWGHPTLPEPTQEQLDAAQPPVKLLTEAEAVAAVQKRLDDFARTRGYDGILSGATYATSTVAKFRAEGQCCVDQRDAHWAKCYEILGEVQAGLRPLPTLEEVMAEMPALVWPTV